MATHNSTLMSTTKLKHKATTRARARTAEVRMCPRPDCPNPTLHVAKSGASRYHCIGCWRRFPSSGRFRFARQQPPPKRWLIEFSPERLNGPPPKLVQRNPTMISLGLRNASGNAAWNGGPSTPPPPVSIATATSIALENRYHEDSFPATSVSSMTWCEEEEDLDDDVVSTARYDGVRSTAAGSRYAAGPSRRSRISSAATPVLDFDADIQDVHFPDLNLSLPNPGHVRSRGFESTSVVVRDESDCESIGSSPDVVEPGTPVEPSPVRDLFRWIGQALFRREAGGVFRKIN